MKTGIKGTAKKTAEKLGNFVEKKREQALVNITNATGTGIFIKWLISNKISVILVVSLVSFVIYSKIQMDYIRERLDKVKIEELQQDLEEERIRTEVLEKRIEELLDRKKFNKEINKDLRKKVEKMSDLQKRALLSEYVDRLLRKRK